MITSPSTLITAHKMPVRVAVGVLCYQGKVLITQRQQHQHLAGLWEFPGGKIEQDETACSALIRELKEELGIELSEDQFASLIKIPFQYSTKKVLLDVYRAELTEPQFLMAVGNEGQPLARVAISDLNNYSFPPANKEIITALSKL